MKIVSDKLINLYDETELGENLELILSYDNYLKSNEKSLYNLLILCFLFLPLLILKVHASETKYVALTFDDGPSKHTITLLDGLAERGVKATFFVAGNSRYPEYLKYLKKEIEDAGISENEEDELKKIKCSVVLFYFIRKTGGIDINKNYKNGKENRCSAFRRSFKRI